jgi:hypothetical protein
VFCAIGDYLLLLYTGRKEINVLSAAADSDGLEIAGCVNNEVWHVIKLPEVYNSFPSQ